MKHLFYATSFMLFLLALASACTEDGEPSMPRPEGSAIDFLPQTATTKAMVESFGLDDQFKVWGGYGGNATGVFNGENVTNTGGGWNYTGGTRYWVDNATYDFYALYPTDVAATVGQDGTIRVENFDCSARGEDAIDLMTAEETGIDGSAHQPVPLSFRHELAQVHVVVRTDPGVTASDIVASFSGFYTQGTLARADETASWENLQNQAPFQMTCPGGLAANSEEDLSGDMLLIPQSTRNLRLSVSLKRGEQTLTADRELDSPTRWEAGQTYRYIIRVEVDAITFSDFTVDEWGETNTGGDINIGQ